jgi:hypothetical protein
MKPLTIQALEALIYAPGGLFDKVITRMQVYGNAESRKLTGKKQQYIDLVRRQHREPSKYGRPKMTTIISLAERLGIK